MFIRSNRQAADHPHSSLPFRFFSGLSFDRSILLVYSHAQRERERERTSVRRDFSLGFHAHLGRNLLGLSLSRKIGRRREMRANCCRSCLVFLLKLLNFFQTFVGVSILIYSVWVLNQTINNGFSLSLDLDRLPAPWFVCALMGAGILLCLVAFTGHIATEAISSCCLCFYAVLITTMILLEAALVGDLFLNKEWKKDLPDDSTGELKKLIAFIEDNMDIFKWAGVSIVVIQALSLLLAVLIRAMIPSRRLDYDSDEDYFVIRRPLINQQGSQTVNSTSGFHSDIWSSRMKQKYGLNPNQMAYNAGDTKAPLHQQQQS